MKGQDVLDYIVCAKKELELREEMKKSKNKVLLIGCSDISMSHELMSKGMYPLVVSGNPEDIIKLVEYNDAYLLHGVFLDRGFAYLKPNENMKFNYCYDEEFNHMNEITGVRNFNGHMIYSFDHLNDYNDIDDIRENILSELEEKAVKNMDLTR